MRHILLLEDDFKMASEVKNFLVAQGYHCDVVYDGLVFFKQLQLTSYDIFILDVNVPSLNGIEVCKRVRESNASIPILVFTAYGAIEDKLEAFNYGADDYLVKPFHFDELEARIKALLRRSIAPRAEEDELYSVDDLLINYNEMKVVRSGREITLTPKEYKLLELLARSKGRAVSKQTISEQVWDINFETGTNTIEVYINFLRNKIDKGFENKLIHTRPGFGYYLRETR